MFRAFPIKHNADLWLELRFRLLVQNKESMSASSQDTTAILVQAVSIRPDIETMVQKVEIGGQTPSVQEGDSAEVIG
jgi:hypothetical protein